MANCNFHLKEADKKGNRLVLIMSRVPDGLFKFSTGVTISPNAKMEVKENRLLIIKSGPESSKQKTLDGYRAAFGEISSIYHPGEPTVDHLKVGMQKYRDSIAEVSEAPLDPGKDFYSLFETIAGKYDSPKTEKNYLAVRSRLMTKYPNFKDFTPEKYSKWLREENAEIKTTAVNAYLDIIKEISKEAFKKRIIKSDPFEEFQKQKAKAGDKAAVALTRSELKRLIEWKAINKSLDRCRDWFLIGCFTGLRSEDLRRLTMDNIVNGTIKIKTSKTGEMFVMKLPIVVERIIKKWKGFPKTFHTTQMNTRIKEVCRFAGLTEKGILNTDLSMELCDAVQAHTARRTFVTIALCEDRVKAATVMAWTLHKTESMLWAYTKPRVRDSDIEAADRDKQWA